MLHLIAVFISGICLGGMAYLLRKLSRNRLPSWIVPVSASLAMFGYLAFYDYSWFGHKTRLVQATQPNALIFDEKRGRSFFKPWSFVNPAVSSFMIFDGQAKTEVQNGSLIAEYFLYEFIKDPIEKQQVYMVILNCSSLERATLAQGEKVQNSRHERVTTDDPIYRQLCLQ